MACASISQPANYENCTVSCAGHWKAENWSEVIHSLTHTLIYFVLLLNLNLPGKCYVSRRVEYASHIVSNLAKIKNRQ